MQKFLSIRCAFALLLLAVGLLFTGCATTEAENSSPRPWNTPQGWGTGLPGGMLDRDRRY